MKKFILFCFLIFACTAHANFRNLRWSAPTPITISGGQTVIDFGIHWEGDDASWANNATVPGQVRLLDASSNVVALLEVSYGGAIDSLSPGTINVTVNSFTSGHVTKQGDFDGAWTIPLPDGVYSLEAFSGTSDGAPLKLAQVDTTTKAAQQGSTAPVVTISATPSRIFDNQSSTIAWTSSNASSGVTVTGNGVASAASSGSQILSTLAPGFYTYTITGTNGGGSATATAILEVDPEQPFLISSSDTPSASISPDQTITMGSSANFVLSSVGAALSGNTLTGDATNLTDPPSSVSVTPDTTGVLPYIYTVQGIAHLLWNVESGGTVTLNGPSSVVDVTSVLSYDVSVPGFYSITVTVNGVSSTSALVFVPINTASAIAHVTVNPRIDAFTGTTAPPPSLVLSPATQTIDFTDPGSLNVSVVNASSSTLSGNNLSVSNPSGTVTFTPNVGGILTYTLSANPGLGVLSWSAAGATSVLVNGSPVSGSSLPVGPGTYSLVVQGNDGTSASAGPVTIAAASSATTTAEVRVRPKIVSFTETDPLAPSASFNLSPSSGVNPLPVSLNWSGSNASTMSISGPSVAASSMAGSASPTLGPGPHTFNLTATPSAAAIAWTVLGADTISLATPTLGALDATPMNGSYAANVSGAYSITATGPDGLTNTSSPVSVTIPPPFIASKSITVDVTLFVGSTAGGSVTGSGVKAYASIAAPTATPGVGYYFAGWSGDYVSVSNPGAITMDNDKAILANFALNNFTISTAVSPVGTGTVTGAGTYTFGANATFTASPDSTHYLVNWSGLLSGSSNPANLVVNAGGTVVANFAIIQYTLTTSTAGAGGGSVTAGGIFPINSTASVVATPNAVSRFQGWSGDAGGTADPLSIVMNGNKNVVAVFTSKLAQTITFPNPGMTESGSTVTLGATASSGLQVSYTIISGPGTMVAWNQVKLSGTGFVTIQATQGGDATYLPAPPVNISFDSLPPPKVTFTENGADTSLENSKNKHPNHTVSGP